MGQRSTRRGRPHCEAFPALDILQAERSLRAGGGSCEWRDEQGVLVGHARMVMLDELLAVFRYDFLGSTNIAAAEGLVSLDVICTRRNTHVVRKSLVCPSCDGSIQKVFFVSGAWGCRVCHDLVFLKQRLGGVNRKINDRDVLLSVLQEVAPADERGRWFHNQQRRVARVNRELSAKGCTSLPQELLYRTTQHWITPGGVDRISYVQQRDLPEGDGENSPSATAGLAIFQPMPMPLEPREPCELIGSAILGRPFRPMLTQRKVDRSEQLQRDLWKEAGCPAGRMKINVTEAARRLAERLFIEPIVITSDWTDMVEVAAVDGRRQYAITASYAGDPTLWPAGPCAKPYKRVIRAILDENVIELRVRLPRTGRSDPGADLDAACTELQRRLPRVEAEFRRFNAMRDQLALKWVRYGWSRKSRRRGIVSKPAAGSM